jgi:hypothetical protein
LKQTGFAHLLLQEWGLNHIESEVMVISPTATGDHLLRAEFGHEMEIVSNRTAGTLHGLDRGYGSQAAGQMKL